MPFKACRHSWYLLISLSRSFLLLKPVKLHVVMKDWNFLSLWLIKAVSISTIPSVVQLPETFASRCQENLTPFPRKFLSMNNNRFLARFTPLMNSVANWMALTIPLIPSSNSLTGDVSESWLPHRPQKMTLPTFPLPFLFYFFSGPIKDFERPIRSSSLSWSWHPARGNPVRQQCSLPFPPYPANGPVSFLFRYFSNPSSPFSSTTLPRRIPIVSQKILWIHWIPFFWFSPYYLCLPSPQEDPYPRSISSFLRRPQTPDIPTCPPQRQVFGAGSAEGLYYWGGLTFLRWFQFNLLPREEGFYLKLTCVQTDRFPPFVETSYFLSFL